ncbi:MAG TPA: hypothetical protein VGR80_00825 [Steroidobacteraceae bacterium]|nr:hypothetical protein [Gammaproteobacteria bacterium]HEV2284557.1 hypothetical protein [Steroidobacteraceae bacterium]
MDDTSRKTQSQESPATAGDAERRRIGLVVHDDRGQASVEWRDAPSDYERPVLEVIGNPQLALKSEESYDPYARHTATYPKAGPGSTTRTDLRKLSEWIKMKRALEERKQRGED